MRYLDHPVQTRTLSDFQRVASSELETSFQGEIRTKKELNPKSAGFLKSHVYQGTDDRSHRKLPPNHAKQDFVPSATMAQQMKAEFFATAKSEVERQTGDADATRAVARAFRKSGIDRDSAALLTGTQVRNVLQRLSLQPTAGPVRHPNFDMPTPYEMNDLQLAPFDPSGREGPAAVTVGWDDVPATVRDRNASIAQDRPQGINKNQARMFKASDGNSDYFVKGASPREIAMERATCQMAAKLGLQDNFLPVATRDAGGEQFMVAPFLPGVSLKAALTDGSLADHPAMKNVSDERLAELFLFDWVREETDRNTGNVWLGQDGRVYGIDNESALGATVSRSKHSIEHSLKNGTAISSYGLGRVAGRDNAFMTMLCQRHGIDNKNLSQDELQQRAKALPFPAAFAAKLIKEEAAIVQDLKDQGINPRFFQEGIAMLKDVVAKGGQLTLADLFDTSATKLPKLTGKALGDETASLFNAFGNG